MTQEQPISEAEINARLIADLLEALEMAVKYIPKGPSSMRFKIEEIIAKARSK